MKSRSWRATAASNVIKVFHSTEHSKFNFHVWRSNNKFSVEKIFHFFILKRYEETRACSRKRSPLFSRIIMTVERDEKSEFRD